MKEVSLFVVLVVFFCACAVEDSVEQATTSAQTTFAVSGSTTSSTGGAVMEENDLTFVAKVSDVPSGSMFRFEHGNDRAVLVNINGNFFAYLNKCTHMGCELALSGGIFKCPCHGSEFDPLSGEALKGPAKKPITSLDVVVEDGSVYVR